MTDPHSPTFTARLLVLGTNSIDQLFPHINTLYLQTTTSVQNVRSGYISNNLVHINSKDDSYYFLHCQSKMFIYGIFWSNLKKHGHY